MKIVKILIGLSILFLLIGTVSATQYENLKAPHDYEDLIAGYTERLDNHDVYFFIDEMEYNKDVFDNKSDNIVEELEPNIYSFTDNRLNMCGVEEKVILDDEEYLIAIIDENSSDGDLDSYLDSMKEFNKINNLEPIAV